MRIAVPILVALLFSVACSPAPRKYDTSSAPLIRCLLSDVIATDQENRGVESAQDLRVYFVAAGLNAKGELEPFDPSVLEAIGLSQVRNCVQVTDSTEEIFLIHNIRWQSRHSVIMDFVVLVPKMASYGEKDPGKWLGGAGSTDIRLIFQNGVWQISDHGASWVQ